MDVAQSDSPGHVNAKRLAKGLGWLSVGLGVAGLVAPRAIERLAGSRPPPGMLIATGALGVATLGMLCARQLQRAPTETARKTTRIVKSIAVNRAPDELYRFWQDLENLPQFMYHLRSVRVTGPLTSHWVANAPAGGYVEWDSEITEDIPNKRIAWRSLAGADVAHTGAVEFERRPGARGSMVRVELEYTPPVGPASVAIAKLFNEAPDQQIDDDLRRFKQLIETGEVQF